MNWVALASSLVAVYLTARILRLLGRMETHTNRKLDHLMSLVSIEQADLDTAAANIETVVALVKAIPPGTLPAADETALNAAIADLQGSVPAAPPAQ